MMMILKRKEVLIGSLIMLILVAAFINYNYSLPMPTEEGQIAGANTEMTATPTPGADAETARKMGEAQYVSTQGESEAVSTNGAASVGEDYFTQAKMNKEGARSKSIELLNEMINNPNVDAESKQRAQEELLSLSTAADKEASCENLIRAKGFSDCVTFISGDGVSVTVKSDGLTGADLAKIQEIVSSQTGISIKNIKIVEVK